MPLSPVFTEAVEYVRAHHEADVRKGTEIPYLAHLLAVTSLVLEHGGDEEQAIAALLHDVVEDGGGERALAEIRERFGDRAADIVLACSDTTSAVKEDWKLRKDRYLAHLEHAPADVLLVSGADKLHNARAILADLRVHGDALWSRFNRGVADQLWYYGTLRDVFLRRCPGPLADELARTVREIERLVPLEVRVSQLGCEVVPIALGSRVLGYAADWPGWPLVIERSPDGSVMVRAEVGSSVEFIDGEDDAVEDVLSDADLDQCRVEYAVGTRFVYVALTNTGSLRETCEQVAAVAPAASAELVGCEYLEFVPPVTDFNDLGPWW